MMEAGVYIMGGLSSTFPPRFIYNLNFIESMNKTPNTHFPKRSCGSEMDWRRL